MSSPNAAATPASPAGLQGADAERQRASVGKISGKCCSFSAVSAPIFATKYAFDSIFQNLPDSQAEFFEIWQNFANFATFVSLLLKFDENCCFFKPIFYETFEIAAVQKDANLVELEKCCRTHIFLQNFVLIQPRTSPPKICKIFEKCIFEVHTTLPKPFKNGSPIMRWRILPRFVTSSIPSARFEQNQPKKCCILRNRRKFTKIIENCTSYQQSRLQNTHSTPAFIWFPLTTLFHFHSSTNALSIWFSLSSPIRCRRLSGR